MVRRGWSAFETFEREDGHARSAGHRDRTRGRGADGTSAAAAGALLECSVGARTRGGPRAGRDRELPARGVSERTTALERCAPPARDRASAPLGEPAVTGIASTVATDFFARFRDQLAKAIVGQDDAIRLCAIALVAQGHVLLE